jgi:hypothetical protein
MPADLTRNVRIYISRTGSWAHADTGSQQETDILSSGKDYRLCASVDSAAQAWRMMDKLCEDFHDGQYFIRPNGLLLTDAELEQTGARIENEYRSMKRATGGIV